LPPVGLIDVLGGIVPTKGRGVVGDEVELFGDLAPDGVGIAALDVRQGECSLSVSLGLGSGRGGNGGASSGFGGDAHAAGGLDALADLGGDGVGGGEEEGGGGGEGHEGQAEGLLFGWGGGGEGGREVRLCVWGLAFVFFKRGEAMGF